MAVYYFDSSAVVKRYAMQLSLALHANALLNADGLSLTLVSGDDQLLQAAQAEGLATDNPFAHAP